MEANDFPTEGAIADYGCGPGTSTLGPLEIVAERITNGSIYLLDPQPDHLWKQVHETLSEALANNHRLKKGNFTTGTYFSFF